MAEPEMNGKDIDLKELIVSLILEVEVLKNCLVEKGLITPEEFTKNINRLREKKFD